MDIRNFLMISGRIIVLPFNRQLYTIGVGRGRMDNTETDFYITIPDISTISRECHFKIFGGIDYGSPEQSQNYIINGKNKNGTYLNGEEVHDIHQKYWLQKGDTITIGEYNIEVGEGIVNMLGKPIKPDGTLVELTERFTVLD